VVTFLLYVLLPCADDILLTRRFCVWTRICFVIVGGFERKERTYATAFTTGSLYVCYPAPVAASSLRYITTFSSSHTIAPLRRYTVRLPPHSIPLLFPFFQLLTPAILLPFAVARYALYRPATYPPSVCVPYRRHARCYLPLHTFSYMQQPHPGAPPVCHLTFLGLTRLPHHSIQCSPGFGRLPHRRGLGGRRNATQPFLNSAAMSAQRGSHCTTLL